MTTLHDTGPAAEGQLHALVIGVDHYPHCGRSTRLEPPWRDFARAVSPLNCAVPSALAVVNWLRRHLSDRVHPVGSIELLLSAQQEQQVDGRDVERATMANVKAAFGRWYDRCDRNPDDVALLFFCGHGLRLSSEDILLLEDFGADRHTVFANAIDFRETYYGMRMAKAGIQCFLLDACRNTPEDLAGRATAHATALKHAPPSPESRDAPIVYSAPPGSRAPAPDGSPTRFTEAAIQALEGGSADHTVPDWPVTTDLLHFGINRLLGWGEKSDGRQYAAHGGQASGGTIHALGVPMVPFRFGCDPHAALPYAHLHLANPDRKFERPPAEIVWRGAAPADSYSLRAEFAAQGYTGDPAIVMLLPPYRDSLLKVKPA
ncbi:caspase family protein [Micromonospora sp. NPDC047134]|uniref:caspase family protein n=1 Tax=Micromonospora sp. NPDC047134 TaxID=3154340 RepID=UPI0033F245E9